MWGFWSKLLGTKVKMTEMVEGGPTLQEQYAKLGIPLMGAHSGGRVHDFPHTLRDERDEYRAKVNLHLKRIDELEKEVESLKNPQPEWISVENPYRLPHFGVEVLIKLTGDENITDVFLAKRIKDTNSTYYWRTDGDMEIMSEGVISFARIPKYKKPTSTGKTHTGELHD